MARFVLAIMLVLVVIYIVPFVVYGVASAVTGLQPPTTASPGSFLLGVLITKLGTAIAFATIFWLSKAVWGPRWLLYALVWFVMFAFSEVGEVVAGRTNESEAVLGIVSEAIYAPLAAFISKWMLFSGTS